MVTHIVLIKPKADTTAEQIQTILEQAKDLQQIIPGIVDAKVGKNQAGHQEGYSYGLIMQFENMEQLQAYMPHPAHQVVGKEIMRLCDSIIEFDLAQ